MYASKHSCESLNNDFKICDVGQAGSFLGVPFSLSQIYIAINAVTFWLNDNQRQVLVSSCHKSSSERAWTGGMEFDYRRLINNPAVRNELLVFFINYNEVPALYKVLYRFSNNNNIQIASRTPYPTCKYDWCLATGEATENDCCSSERVLQCKQGRDQRFNWRSISQ